MRKKFVVWFSEVDKDDIGLVGGKGANLGEMTKAGFPVPPGFIVTAAAYFDFLSQNDLAPKLKQILDGLDVSDSKALERASESVQRLIIRGRFPREISQDILEAYFSLEKGLFKHALVAVRSSATAEDLPGASFAGQQSTFLNVQGEANLIEKMKEAWASLFTARAIFYRQTNKFDHLKVGIAVPVQKMVNADASGIMFTLDPVTNDKHKITIEAITGLGEMIVQGAVTPDHYEVDKRSEVITAKEVRVQEKEMVREGRKTVIRELRPKDGARQKLNDEQILAVARLGKALEKHYFFPQDSEWAIADGRIYVVQTRPVTTVGRQTSDIGDQTIRNPKSEIRNLIVRGSPASPGIKSGVVKILRSAKEIDKIISGDVLVAEQTNPDFVPAMRKAVAIVTERGGRTSHAAIVSRELGIPAVVGAAGALSKLKDGMVISVNGTTGEVYKGATMNQELRTQNSMTKNTSQLKTATKVYVNLAEASRAAEIGKRHVDGVGLLRAEFMIAGIGVHPKKLIKDKKTEVFIDQLADELEKFCVAFSPRPVVYRTTDFKTNEYRHLKGGEAFEPEEPNPMLGFRGAARYIVDAEVFKLELEAIKKVRNKLGHKNLNVMVPFVRTPEELLKVKQLMASNGLSRSANFKLWMMVEIPTNVIRIEDFLEVGIDGISIGSNDLTMLTLGTDRDNSEVAHDFSELDKSVIWMFEKVIKACSKVGVTTSMCGQAPSDYPELLEKLVYWGITSVSVNPDVIEQVRETIANAEKKLITRRH